MTLTYAHEAALVDAARAPGMDWAQWAGDQRPPAHFLALWSGRAVHGFTSPERVGGVVVQPADVVLGIRSWDDAFEGILEVAQWGNAAPFALFEVEKIVRMMLHQSGLAFEILASPAVLHDADFPARRIVDAAVTRGVLHHYRDVAQGQIARLERAQGQGVRPADLLDIARHALTGVALADGLVDFHLWELVDAYGSSTLEGLLREAPHDAKLDDGYRADFARAVESLIERIDPDAAKLPDNPEDYDYLNDLVVTQRQNAVKQSRS